eukprot:TRINITY_DN26864_c0_g1_i1.p1 TRINITY_DN26864_c0_g1~~TRINITY_DN26864_c0_g1_i1.p1  ORF type:complete len:292 (-),score=40.91 TRINITY_DN26864_c0_g1_i1:49-924(-)
MCIRDRKKEMLLVDRIIYKSCSQHKGAKHFKHLQQVSRSARNLGRVGLVAAIDAVEQLFCKYSTQRLSPTAEAVAWVLVLTITLDRALAALACSISKCLSSMRGLLSDTFFMSLALVMVSICSRLYVIYRQLACDVQEFYKDSWNLMQQLPTSSATHFQNLARDLSWMLAAPQELPATLPGRSEHRLLGHVPCTAQESEHPDFEEVDDFDLGGKVDREAHARRTCAHLPTPPVTMLCHRRPSGKTAGASRSHNPKKLSLIHISEPTRLLSISYAVFCLKKKKHTQCNETNT